MLHSPQPNIFIDFWMMHKKKGFLPSFFRASEIVIPQVALASESQNLSVFLFCVLLLLLMYEEGYFYHLPFTMKVLQMLHDTQFVDLPSFHSHAPLTGFINI